MASEHNFTKDNLGRSAWFRLEQNDMTLVVETDDTATDNNGQDIDQTLVIDGGLSS